ncbi:helix-turn-helix transcriptional regulator [Empedobacter falsenii]|uniref:helix-turn-helix domain-containing protein n=1 Tax=Empedobacter falsenii TaxID=343874 RepID=UPI0025769F34|nr:helix-turn-helix transcriptional regulator [Empedobacter falsenii]MDM1547421.1 helix-turn-helix transcriptional regulator [Empedobacter falsenii]
MNNIELKEFRKKTGLNQKDFAKKLDVHYRTVQKWESGETEISSKNEKHILNTFTKNENVSDNFSPNKSQSIVSKNKVEIPYYNVDFSGGWKSEDLFTTHQPSFFITNPEFTRAEFACNLIGNSISRRIPHNAIIGLKEIKEWKVYFPTNEIYAVVMKNELRTVKIVKRSANKDFLILIPDPLDIYNQTGYEPEEVPIDFIEKFFQVVAWGQFEKLAM